MITFRRMRFRDLVEVQRLNARAISENLLLGTFIDTISASYYTSFVAEAEGKIVGYIEARAGGREGTICSVCVDGRHRRQGIGRKLVALSLKAIEATMGSGTIWLYVREENAAAIKLYESMGFSIVDRSIPYYEAGALAHRMCVHI
jgi:ribosomal protein S18 acetylase RimI-like enzyme